MAERVGFEPTVEFPQHTLSKRAPSTTRTPLRALGSPIRLTETCGRTKAVHRVKVLTANSFALGSDHRLAARLAVLSSCSYRRHSSRIYENASLTPTEC